MTVEFRLSQLNDILQRTVETMRGDDVIQGKKAMAILQNWCGENCSFEKVFGSVRGMLPATAPGRNTPVSQSLQLCYRKLCWCIFTIPLV